MNQSQNDVHAGALVMVVDDEPTTRLSISKSLERWGYRVVEAEHGAEALDLFKQRQPDLVLMDVHMPVLSGIDACAMIKQCPGGKDTPVLMITAHQDSESVERAYTAGAWDYVAKPIHWTALRNRIRLVLDFQANQKHLSQVNSQYLTLLNAFSEGICRVDQDGKILYANPSLESLCGTSMETLFGTPIDRLLQRHERYGDCSQMLRQSARFKEREFTLRREDGVAVPVLISSAPVRSNGETQGAVLTVLNISERKAAEHARIQASRMEVAESMAGGIAHDFNNLMTVVLGQIDLLKQDRDLSDDNRLDTVSRSAKRAAELASQLIAYAGGGCYDVGPVDFGRLLGDLPFQQWCSSETITHQLVLAEKIPAVSGDEGQLRQLVRYLFLNAVEALALAAGAGSVLVRLTVMDLAGRAESKPERCADGSYLCLDVVDSGVGMDEATLRRAFEPFYSNGFRGKGLGLAAVQGIARNHSGFVRLESREGVGCKARVYLPALSAETR